MNYILLTLMNLAALALVTAVALKSLTLLGEMAVLLKSEGLGEAAQYNQTPKSYPEAQAAIDSLRDAEASEAHNDSSIQYVTDKHGNEYHPDDLISLS